MLLEIKRVITAEVNFRDYNEMVSELNIENEEIARNIWAFCLTLGEEKLSSFSECFLEEVLKKNQVDTETCVECEVDLR